MPSDKNVEQRTDPPTDDLTDRLDQALPTTIRLAEGEHFVGTYVRLDKGETAGYGPAWIAVLADDNGEEHGLWLLHTALLNKMKRLAPKPGERLAVKYLGQRDSGSGRRYHDWRVLSGAEQRTAFDWGDVEGDSADSASDQFNDPAPF
jgi:hypothetical protein